MRRKGSTIAEEIMRDLRREQRGKERAERNEEHINKQKAKEMSFSFAFCRDKQSDRNLIIRYTEVLVLQFHLLSYLPY